MDRYDNLIKGKFIKEHEKMRKEYRKTGMSEEEIDEIFLYDWDRYREQRNDCVHTLIFTVVLVGKYLSSPE